ncbi:MAG: glutamate-5-semialdehyde dehydrogenase [Alphaproteobacteria bacterium 64-11]|nr:glutamate-5-semialdehyde dehydrogenase [Alphaproteobacteria bacterium]OJU14071.1 MAG: glutamate-5-semialdehyde dehydrogenase [Alphaproteobacteria bacterium 64-11]
MTVHNSGDALAAEMLAVGAAARQAARAMREASAEQKTRALMTAAAAIRAAKDKILDANRADIEAAKAAGMPTPMVDRLMLNDARIEAMAKGVEVVAALPDPVGRELARWTRPNGLDIARVATPIGVVGIIYESRPNVTADAGALTLKSGNAAILRGGSDSIRSAGAIHAAMTQGLKAAGLPETAIQYVKTSDRAAVGMMLEGLDGNIDLIIPRGGKGLTGRVMAEARVPVLAHLEGLCHVYLHEAADLAKARAIALNAKMRRTSVCGAAETLLIDRKVLSSHGLPVLADLATAGCEIRGDDAVRSVFPPARLATEEDWRTEYLDAIIAVRCVDGLEEAIAHIETYGSHHTDAIVTEDAAAAEKFMNSVDSAIVLWNASTQFADGGEFGMGAEIGIGTGKMHARGPVGAEQLTTFKYVVRGTGQTRP